jgi:Flp pilus assembly protein TadG
VSRRGRCEPLPRDRGTVSLFTVIFAVFVILLAGLLVDGGLAIHARQRAADIAEQGARAAADDIDLAYLRTTGRPRIADGDSACARARRLVARYPEVNGDVGCVVSGDRQSATVEVTIQVELQLLSIMPGFGTFTMTSRASAHPQAGV